MSRPAADFELLTLYNGAVQMKFYPKSHTYKVLDPEHNRQWEVAPSATGLTDSMEKGSGLMVYAMSEAMKYMDQVFQNKGLKSMVDDAKFTFQQLFKDARAAHIEKSALGKRVGTAAHGYVEQLLASYKQAQDTGGVWKVPVTPKALDLAAELRQSWENIISVYDFTAPTHIDKYREVVNRDIEIRGRIWRESMMVQRACQAAREFILAAAKAQVLKVWAVEQVVHSREFFFTGRFDAILEFIQDFPWRGYTLPAGVYIADMKTSNPGTDYPMGIYPNHLAQVGLYDVAYCEEYPDVRDRIKGHLILGSSKTGEGFHPYASLERRRNREWGKSLVPVVEYMHQAEKELKGLQLYGGNK
jgi:hypothetical protein